MKDIVITGAKVRRELFILLGCLVFAECVNVFAILKYDRPAIELISMIGYVIVTALIVYVILLFVRAVVALIVYIVKKFKA